MREIKFRAWDKRQKQMSGIFTLADITQYEHIFERMFNQLARFNDLIWLEYTGLKDKNGKEIYQGDILSYQEPEFVPLSVVVEWGDGSFIIRWLYNNAESPIFSYPLEYLEVIGNVMENPELLESKDNADS